MLGSFATTQLAQATYHFIPKDKKHRTPGLEELDIQYMRAQEAGEDTSEIVATKNKLRDFPAKPEIDSATTVEELKAIWDNDLGDK